MVACVNVGGKALHCNDLLNIANSRSANFSINLTYINFNAKPISIQYLPGSDGNSFDSQMALQIFLVLKFIYYRQKCKIMRNINYLCKKHAVYQMFVVEKHFY